MRYRFTATTTRFEPPPRALDPDSAEFMDYPPRFRLYDVRLVLSYEGQQREYLYQELAWLPRSG